MLVENVLANKSGPEVVFIACMVRAVLKIGEDIVACASITPGGIGLDKTQSENGKR